MSVVIRAFQKTDTLAAIRIWNQVVEDGRAFPQTECLSEQSGCSFFEEQSYTALAEDEFGEIVGLYILHPNNIGRCGHIANASYAVERAHRGEGIGEAMVRDCLQKGKELGFRVLQFNAVVRSNEAALSLYRKLGFVQLGVIPGGFLNCDGIYEDIILHYHLL